MAKFRYRMQNILSVKEKLETQAKNEFSIAAAAVMEEEEKLDKLIARREEYRDLLRRLQQGELDFKSIKEATESVNAMKYLIEDQRQVLSKAEKLLELKSVALAEAVKEVKTHEKLKEKEFIQFMADEASRESKEIDELVSYRFGQKEEE